LPGDGQEINVTALATRSSMPVSFSRSSIQSAVNAASSRGTVVITSWSAAFITVCQLTLSTLLPVSTQITSWVRRSRSITRRTVLLSSRCANRGFSSPASTSYDPSEACRR
jgi:hypothetical protein